MIMLRLVMDSLKVRCGLRELNKIRLFLLFHESKYDWRPSHWDLRAEQTQQPVEIAGLPAASIFTLA
jgi:hypothetical protein